MANACLQKMISSNESQRMLGHVMFYHTTMQVKELCLFLNNTNILCNRIKFETKSPGPRPMSTMQVKASCHISKWNLSISYRPGVHICKIMLKENYSYYLLFHAHLCFDYFQLQFSSQQYFYEVQLRCHKSQVAPQLVP
ncbi:hypothetical protein ACB094_06G188100 [Castanea mollissima]